VTEQQRRLVLIRHAQAEGLTHEDRSRALTGRGRRDAVEAGLWLAGHDVVPDHVFVSSASRTVDTWESLVRGLRSGAAEVTVEDALYSAEPETVLDVLRTAPIDARVVALVGHNPAVAYLAHILDDGHADPVAFREMSEGYPTAAVTVLEVPVSWSDLDIGTARVAAFHVGRG